MGDGGQLTGIWWWLSAVIVVLLLAMLAAIVWALVSQVENRGLSPREGGTEAVPTQPAPLPTDGGS
jgi:hypothetical protein